MSFLITEVFATKCLGGEHYDRAPAVVINPQYKQATEGDRVSFDCEAEGTPIPTVS